MFLLSLVKKCKAEIKLVNSCNYSNKYVSEGVIMSILLQIPITQSYYVNY